MEYLAPSFHKVHCINVGNPRTPTIKMKTYQTLDHQASTATCHQDFMYSELHKEFQELKGKT